MSVVLAQKTIGTVNQIRRTWRTNLESPVGADVIVTAHREDLDCTESGEIIRQVANGQVTRSLAAVATEAVALADGTELSALQVAEAVGIFIEAWDAEDRAAASPAPAQEEVAP